MRCDLHVHTSHSGMCTIPAFAAVCRESYNDPLAVYEKLKRLGMDLVTVTDHDSIDAVEALRSRPDFFLSEEVTCTPAQRQANCTSASTTSPSATTSRSSAAATISNRWSPGLRERDLFFSANHVFSSLTGRRSLADFALFEAAFPALETRNGHMLARANENAAVLADLAATRRSRRQRRPRHGVGGLRLDRGAAARAAARNTSTDCAADMGRVRGETGGYWKLTRDVLTIGRDNGARQPADPAARRRWPDACR